MYTSKTNNRQRNRENFQENWLEKFLTPNSILCDQSVQYTSQYLPNLCKDKNIKIKHATKNNPQGNGIVERRHRIINEMLRMNKKYTSKSRFKHFCITD